MNTESLLDHQDHIANQGWWFPVSSCRKASPDWNCSDQTEQALLSYRMNNGFLNNMPRIWPVGSCVFPSAGASFLLCTWMRDKWMSHCWECHQRIEKCAVSEMSGRSKAKEWTNCLTQGTCARSVAFVLRTSSGVIFLQRISVESIHYIWLILHIDVVQTARLISCVFWNAALDTAICP